MPSARNRPDHRHRDLRQPQAVADHINQRHGPFGGFSASAHAAVSRQSAKNKTPFLISAAKTAGICRLFYYIYTTLTTLQHGCKDRPPTGKSCSLPEFEKPYFADLTQFVRQEYATRRIYPRGSNIFRAFDKCPFDKLKVVIIGQDPYHGPGQANGLCFSVGDGVPFPPSLQNIFKEVADDTGTPPPATGNLDRWAEQGVLLLNAVLTVRATKRRRTRAAAGKPSPTPWYARSPNANRASSTCFGAVTPKKRRHRRSAAELHSQGRTPVAALGLPRILRLPPLLARQRISPQHRQGADRVVTIRS